MTKILIHPTSLYWTDNDMLGTSDLILHVYLDLICLTWYVWPEIFDLTWTEMTWNDLKWPEMTWNDLKWTEIIDLTWPKIFDIRWPEMINWSDRWRLTGNIWPKGPEVIDWSDQWCLTLNLKCLEMNYLSDKRCLTWNIWL